MVMNANLRMARAAEILLSLISVSAVKRIRFPVIDPLHFKAFVQGIP